VPHGRQTPRSKNTATCFPTAGNPHKNSRPKSGRLSFYGLPAIADGCTILQMPPFFIYYCVFIIDVCTSFCCKNHLLHLFLLFQLPIDLS
jgi:hypothetical protein